MRVVEWWYCVVLTMWVVEWWYCVVPEDMPDAVAIPLLHSYVAVPSNTTTLDTKITNITSLSVFVKYVCYTMGNLTLYKRLYLLD